MRDPAGSRRRAAVTLVEALVAMALVSIALALVLNAMVGTASTTSGRMERTAEITQTARVAEIITWDLNRAVVTADGPRVLWEGCGVVLPVREGGKDAPPTSVCYRFNPRTGFLERGGPQEVYKRVGNVRFEKVSFEIALLPGDVAAASGQPARPLVVQSILAPRLASRERSGAPASPVSTRSVEIVTARVLEPDPAGDAPEGWMEPGAAE